MSQSLESESVETLEFKWGTKRGRGGKKKEVQFYESFRYDGVDYTLYDTVYLYEEGEPEPYIGKIIKIWEIEDKTSAKKVKVHWFFRPSEISNWIEEGMVLEKEIFLASGEGVCTASVNPLEAISGKCNVVCTLKDERNPLPSAQELELADYFFYRTFDVESCNILDLVGDKVAGLDVKFVFNRKENKNDTAAIAEKKQEEGKPTLIDATDSNDVARNSFKRTLSLEKDTSLNKGSENIENKMPNVIFPKAAVGHEIIVSKESGALENRLPSKSISDYSEPSPKKRDAKNVEALNIDNNDTKPLKKSSSFTDKNIKIDERKDSVAAEKVPKVAKSSSFTDRNMKNEERKDHVGSERVPKVDKSDKNIVTKSVNKDSFQKLDATSGKNDGKNLVISGKKRKPDDDDMGPEKDPKQHKSEEKMAKVSVSKLINVGRDSPHEERSRVDKFEVTRRPTKARNTWFRQAPWEEQIKTAYEQGTLVQLSNLDPHYSSSEVEDIIWHAFEEYCTSAKMVQRTATSSPHYGHAHVIMKTRASADKIIKKLEDGCLMLSNGRPLVGSRASPPSFQGKQSTFIGHLSVDKMKHLMQRDMREAVSTSHCSQPNTIEFEMALEWCLLQSRSDSWWKRLYKQQGEELRKLKGNLKLKG